MGIFNTFKVDDYSEARIYAKNYDLPANWILSFSSLETTFKKLEIDKESVYFSISSSASSTILYWFFYKIAKLLIIEVSPYLLLNILPDSELLSKSNFVKVQ